MKNILMLLIAFIAGIFFVAALSWKNNASHKQSSSIDGAWETVSFKRNNKAATNNQYKLFSNGFFSLVSWDSAGKFSYGGFGKYELDGKMYKETFLYHNNSTYKGAMDWQEYELKGDTLIMRGFNKVIVGGKDVTADFPKIEEKRMRVK